MFDQDTITEITAVAAALGLEPAALLAVAEVESGGKAVALIDGKPEPLIRFEGHYFDKRLTGDKKMQARAAGLASPLAGAVANPRTQSARWKLLARAAAIDRVAAYESVSWGIGQVMGAHWAWLGYSSVDALVAEARAGAGGQVRLMARFIGKAGLKAALAAHDWHAFARGYNGPQYKRNAYHSKLAEAYRRHAATARAQKPAPRAAVAPLASMPLPDGTPGEARGKGGGSGLLAKLVSAFSRGGKVV